MPILGGQERTLTGWAPSRLRLGTMKPSVELAALPMLHSIAGFPTDYDQGHASSCGPNSVGEFYEYKFHRKFSPLFLYFLTRVVENDQAQDSGVELPDLLTVAHTMGMPPEEFWPYDLDKLHTPPTLAALVAAFAHRVERWDVIADLDHALFEIANDQPITFGFQVPASIESAATQATGVVAMPVDRDDSVGGHAVNAIKYDRERQLVGCTSHWGSSFGDGGLLWLPFGFFEQRYATDLVAIRSIT